MRVAGVLLVAALWAPAAPCALHTRTVVATAYNGTEAQTDGDPLVGAWGDRMDRLPKGVRAIAVSPDLLARGLKHGMRVRIKGLKGEFVVLDKMPKRWTRRVDIYMDLHIAAARRWGRRWVTLYWNDV